MTLWKAPRRKLLRRWYKPLSQTTELQFLNILDQQREIDLMLRGPARVGA